MTKPDRDFQLVMGLDPGINKTGMAVLRLDPVAMIGTSGRWNNLRVLDWIRVSQPDLVICEGFRVRPNLVRALVGSELHEVRMIGKVEEVCRLYDIPFHEIQPSASKMLVSDEDLRESGIVERNAHVRDAWRCIIAIGKKTNFTFEIE